ncbi:MAG: imm11 family protein [Sediminibacterium sp.]
MYFRISKSLDRKIIGSASDQAIHAKIDIHIDHPNYFTHHLLKKVENVEDIVCPKPILEKNAKLTDLITYPGIGGSILVSNKLKKILYACNHSGIQYFPTSLIADNTEMPDYWIVNPYQFDYDCIDLTKTRLTIKNFENHSSEIKTLSDKNELIRLIEDYRFPILATLDPFYLKEDSKIDLIIMRNVYSAIGFYVSEKLKKEIEDGGCTGIVFIKPE